MRRSEDYGQKQLEPEVLKVRVLSYYQHLNNLGIEPNEYNKVYEMAVEIHAEDGAKGPFGITEVIRAAKRLKESKVITPSFVNKARVRATSCESCKGSGLKFDSSGSMMFGNDGRPLKCELC